MLLSPLRQLGCSPLLLLLLLLLLLGCCPLASARSGMRVDIDEETWPEVLTGGRWFIKFYAPWCEACASLAPAWQNLAASDGLPRDVSVAQVDVTKNEALAGMFLVTGLPSLYMLHDGQFWQYNKGDRSLPALLRYVQLAEYTREPPLPWYRAPDALHMRALGRLIQAAVRLKQLHSHLVEARGIPSPVAYVALALVTLAGGLLAGLAIVCLCDLALGALRRRRGPPPGGAAGVPAAAADNAKSVAAASTARSLASGEGEGDDEEDEGGDSDELPAEPSLPEQAAAAASTAVRKRAVRKETS